MSTNVCRRGAVPRVPYAVNIMWSLYACSMLISSDRLLLLSVRTRKYARSFKYLKSRKLRHIQLEWNGTPHHTVDRTVHRTAIGNCSSCDKQINVCFFFFLHSRTRPGTPIYPFHKKRHILKCVHKNSRARRMYAAAVPATYCRHREHW